MPSSSVPVTLVVPAYNEAARLPESLEKIKTFCASLTFECEVLVVVEKSTDGTLDLARRCTAGQVNFGVIANPEHRGKGFAVRTGMLKARGEIVMFTDADLSTPLIEVCRFLEFMEAHPEVDVVVGNRKHPESRIHLRQSPLRQKMGETFNWIIRGLAGLKTRDTQCGFKAFRRNAVQEIFSRQTVDGFAFDVEVLLLADALGLKVCDRPVEWVNSPGSKVRIVTDSLQMLRDAIRLRRVVARNLQGESSARAELQRSNAASSL